MYPGNRPGTCPQSSGGFTVLGTTSNNSPQEHPFDSSNQSDSTTLFGPFNFNALTAENLEVHCRQNALETSKHVLKSIRQEMEEIRSQMRSLQLRSPGLEGLNNTIVSPLGGEARSNEPQVSQPRPGIETPVHNVNGISAKIQNMESIMPQSPDAQAEQIPLDSISVSRTPTPAVGPPLATSTHLATTTAKPSTVLIPATAQGGREAAVISWLTSIPEDHEPIPNKQANAQCTPECTAPDVTCSEEYSEAPTAATGSLVYSRLRERLDYQIKHLRKCIKERRTRHKAEKVARRAQSIRCSSQQSQRVTLVGTGTSHNAATNARDDARYAEMEARLNASISAMKEDYELKFGELNAAFGARVADLEEGQEIVAQRLANVERNMDMLVSVIEHITDPNTILWMRPTQQLISMREENAKMPNQRRGVGPGQGEAFRI